MFKPFGRSVPSLKINLISCCLRLMLVPEHCFKPQTMMSSREWEAELKCSATGNPLVWFLMLRRFRWNIPLDACEFLRCTGYCSDDKKCNTQHSQTDRWSGHGCCVLFGSCRKVWEFVCIHRRSRQGNEPACGSRWGISLVYEDITDVSFTPMWCQRRSGENPACFGIGGRC